MDNSSTFHSMCRCCLKKNGPMKNLLSPDSASKNNLLVRYTTCSGIALNPDTSSCQTICFKCEEKLQSSYEFRELCQASHKVLQERSSSIKNEDWVSNSESFVYAEHRNTQTKRTRAESDIFSHQVFVVNAVESAANPVCEVKSEPISDTESDDKEQREDVENVKEGLAIKKEPLAVAKISTPIPVKTVEDSVASEGDDDRPMDQDYDSYDDSVNVKNETKSASNANTDLLLLEGNFFCLVCEITCDNLHDLRTHRKSHIWDIGTKILKRICKLCNTYTDNYVQHLSRMHVDHKPNSCRQCKLSFAKPCSLQNHLLTHLEGTRFPCKGCAKKFANTMHLKEHISKTRHSVHMYTCRECGILFCQYKDLDAHWLAQHQESTGRRRFYPCFSCKNTFNSRQQVVKHNCDPENSLHLAYMDKKRFEKLQGYKPKSKKKAGSIKLEPGTEAAHKCDRCLLAFMTEDEMVCHQNSLCQEKQRYFCKICNLEFKKFTYLTGHNRSKHEERKNICDICGLTWPTENILKTHKKMVHSERSQACAVCGMAFKTEAALRGHQKVHTNLADRRIYECYYCAKKFPKLASIDRHMARHMIATEAIYKCGFCEKTFRLLCDKRGHERGHKVTAFPCNLCGNEYSRLNVLRRHIETAHDGLRYVCNICHQSVGSKRKLYDHYFSHRGFKPYQCTACSHQELTKSRFKNHLKKQHNIEYSELIHRYVEQDPNILKIIEGCLTTDNKNPTKSVPAAKRHKGPSSTYASASMEDDGSSGLHSMYMGHSSF